MERKDDRGKKEKYAWRVLRQFAENEADHGEAGKAYD